VKIIEKPPLAIAVLFLFVLIKPGEVIPATSQGGIKIAEAGAARAAIVLGENSPASYSYAASELQRYLRLLTGAEIKIVPDSESKRVAPGNALLLVGGPTVNKRTRDVASVLKLDFGSLKPEGFFIKTSQLGKTPIVLLAGNDGFSTLYAVYELVERLGMVYRLTGDIVPPRQSSLLLPALDVRKEPAMPRRGFLLQVGGYENLTMFSLDDYKKLLDQMAKMKCNYMQFWWFAFEPWLKSSYRGESARLGDVSTKESGYMTWAHDGFGSRTTDDVSIGKELFQGRRMAPPEMQNVETPDEAFAVAQGMLQKIIHYAAERGIKVWPALETAALPPNLARYCDRVGDLPFHIIFGTFVHPLDPVNQEIQAERLKALIQTYPEAEGYFLVFPEMYPELATDKYRDAMEKLRPQFFQLRELRWPWINWGNANNSDRLVDSNAGYYELFKFLLKKRDEISPHARIGAMGIGRGYALPLFDKLLSKDIPFTDMESSGVWTPAGVPMDYFGGMGERERTIEPRVDDDINMMGMQFNVMQYSKKDKIFTEGMKYGLSGFAGQLNRARGTETNSLFLTEAAWAPQLTGEDFYKRYSERVFGPQAAPAMYRAFIALEENEAHLGYYNYGFTTMNCCGPLPEVQRARLWAQHPNFYDGAPPEEKGFINQTPAVIQRFEGSMNLLEASLKEMRAALPVVSPQGEYELRYMINRTESYRDFIGSLVTIRKAYLHLDQALQEQTKLPREQFVKDLESCLGEFELANRQIQAATRHYTEIMDHPSDLGVLYHLNARGIIGFDLALQFVRNIVNFHRGQPYFNHVPFERLYSPDLRIANEK